jgi:enterobacterial common antigen flippase
MSLSKATAWSSLATGIKILCGLLVIKCIAVSYGPGGVGLASNYRQLITVLGIVAGAGIFNGITKLVAEYSHSPKNLEKVLKTGSFMVLLSSLLFAVLFFSLAPSISIWLFQTSEYAVVIRILALLQMSIGWANFLQAILRGQRALRSNALVTILAALFSVPAYLLCWQLGGYRGALIGLALIPALALLPALLLIYSDTPISFNQFKPSFDRAIIKQLGKYLLMSLTTVLTLPVAWIIMRKQLAIVSDWHQVGLWQGVNTISDVYLQFITTAFSAWLLPTLAKLKQRQQIVLEIRRTFKFVLPIVVLFSGFLWLARGLVIELLFTNGFAAMRDLFSWQLAGDVLKTSSYIFGYLVIAKGALRLYLLAELSQFALLLMFSHWLIPLRGLQGAAESYFYCYCCYFCMCCLAFSIWYRKCKT